MLFSFSGNAAGFAAANRRCLRFLVIKLLALSAQYSEHCLCNGTMSVRLSVCLSHSPTAAASVRRVCGAWVARRVADADRLLHGLRRNSTAPSSKCG